MPSQANPQGKPGNAPLAEGTTLENYRILRPLAVGGFSTVYLAHDEKEQPVVIKEYLPATLATREPGETVPRVAEADQASFKAGVKSFFEEGRKLAHLAHPNVVRVLNFFRANDTVYMVMRYERGRSLQEHIQSRRGPLDEGWIRSTFAQLLNGLREVHTNKLLHLDIKPGNVYLRNDGTPLLIDFGAARQALSEEDMKRLPTYTPGFASPEQHAQLEHLGPWSDIYAVGATLYACLAATAPQPADLRVESDQLVPASRTWSGEYSADLLRIIDWCLKLDPLERPQSVFTLQKALVGERRAQPRGAKQPLMGKLRGMLRRVT
ncbi:MAG TPA: serine/threonine-protein kinase [Burkholderiales bacterium]